MRILLAAEESAGLQTLRQLSRMGYRVVGVLTSSKGGQGGTNVAGVARQLGYTILPGELVKDPAFASWVRKKGVDVLLNVHALYIIHPAIIDAVRIGAFNLHPGPLPAYAGLNAPSWAIINGESTHAVTLHWIDSGIDSGDIAYQAAFPISDTDTGLSVSMRCLQEGMLLVGQLLRDLGHEPARIPRQAQESQSRRIFYRKEIPWNGFVQWGQFARTVDAFVRAFCFHPFVSPWGYPQAILGNRQVGIIKTTLTHEPCHRPPGSIGHVRGRSVAVSTGDEWLLADRCHVAGHVVNGSAIVVQGATS